MPDWESAGGEKRRLSIACALIAQPSLLFLDEPTTGLDSFAALNIMEHMSGLAAMGHTIVASIHQPRTAIWDMFHKVATRPRQAPLAAAFLCTRGRYPQKSNDITTLYYAQQMGYLKMSELLLWARLRGKVPTRKAHRRTGAVRLT